MSRRKPRRQTAPSHRIVAPNSFASPLLSSHRLTRSSSSFAAPRMARWVAALSLAVTAALVVLLLATRHRPEPVTATNAVGDATCLSCHREQAAFEHTA